MKALDPAGKPNAVGGSPSGLLQALEAQYDEAWRPLICRLRDEELRVVTDACAATGVAIMDRLDEALLELMAVRNPHASQDELTSLLRAHVDDRGGRDECGVWVFFPWRRVLLHTLPALEYFEVITSRNQDKITRQEQETLRHKRVAVVGLSVGAEAAVTVAQEHLCGHIRLADFDRLDLSNLNRLGASLADLGQPKARLAARRIAEIDPFLDVVPFEEGINGQNMDAFLRGIDLLVEECDDPQLKLAIRQRARELGIDVVYAADERGFLSVEPYKSRPSLPPFHGLVQDPVGSRSDYPDSRSFYRDLTQWLGGWTSISPESRRSVEHIGSKVNAYPQLAGEARLAAGMVAHVVRRLLLGDPLAPFYGHMDLKDVLPMMGGETGGGR